MPNRSLLFDALFEPMVRRKAPQRSAIDMMTNAGLKKVIQQLSSSKLFPAMSDTLPEFEKIAMSELKLAAKMDALSARRALAIQSIRQGKPVEKHCLQELAREMQVCSEEFTRLWHCRNKPSRLRDNLRLFTKTQQQMLRFADKLV